MNNTGNNFTKFLYGNIGKKLKGLAMGVFIVEAIGSFITAIALMAEDEDLIPIGFLFLFFGPVIAWVSSWLLYGFGELVDKVCDINRNTGGEVPTNAPTYNNAYNNTYAPNYQPMPNAANPNSSTGYVDVYCPNCGQTLSFPQGTASGLCPNCNTTFNL